MQKSLPGDHLPAEGYVVEIGGKFDSEYATFTAALKAGLELKNKNAQVRVKIYEATERAAAPA